MLARRSSARTPSPKEILVAFFLAFAGHAAATESDRPLAREADKIRRLLIEGQFSEIEAIESRSRDLTITIEDGQQLRAALFHALGCACSDRTTEGQLEYVKAAAPRIEEWRKAYPQSSTARIAEAGIRRQQAWAVRGQGYASSVPESAWPIFRANIARAAKLLDDMPPSAKTDAAWYQARLEVARDQSMNREASKAMLEEALQRYPRYMPLYFTGAAFHAPKWGGSREELNAYIEDVVTRTRPWAGEMMYARLQWSEQERDMFRSGQADWPRMMRGFEKLVVDYPSPWNLNNYAKFACLAGDPVTTLRIIRKIEGHVFLEAWGNMEYFGYCKGWAALKAR